MATLPPSAAQESAIGRVALLLQRLREEPHHPEVDRCVLDFVCGYAFTPRDFVIDAKGVCRLHPGLARLVVGSITLGQPLREEIVRPVARLQEEGGVTDSVPQGCEVKEMLVEAE